ncbi:MAG TPA: M48 family metalloprotease [Mariprofundaceae bacterium]|nr:M48 family metalloprotease [Mariprofundaceae bacterium]
MKVYKHEESLFVISMVISTLFWLLITVGTLGIALIYLLLFFLLYLFTHSALIAHLKGTAVKITPEQFPDLYQSFVECCNKVHLSPCPDAYLLHGNGIFNAFATKFLGRNFVVLLSDVVDALEECPDAINFYIGHELGHIKQKHLKWGAYLAPSSILPLLGTAYARAREYTCDQYGLACCASSDSAVKGLAALAAGQHRWRKMNMQEYMRQAEGTGGFWMSFHELTGDYPWLVKRVAMVSGQPVAFPRRSFFAWLLSAFVPRFGMGGASSLIIMVAIIGMLAAVAIPEFMATKAKAQIMNSLSLAEHASKAVEDYYYKNHDLPEKLEDIGVSSHPDSPVVKEIRFDNNDGTLHLVYAIDPIKGKSLDYSPRLKDDKIFWICSSEEIPAGYLPEQCK